MLMLWKMIQNWMPSRTTNVRKTMQRRKDLSCSLERTPSKDVSSPRMAEGFSGTDVGSVQMWIGLCLWRWCLPELLALEFPERSDSSVLHTEPKVSLSLGWWAGSGQSFTDSDWSGCPGRLGYQELTPPRLSVCDCDKILGQKAA